MNKKIICLISSDSSVLSDYIERYINPLGNPRIAAKGDRKNGLVVKCNSAGAMELIWINMYVISDFRGGYELEPKEKMSTGDWIGDIEPESSWMGIWIDESEKSYSPPESFEYDIVLPLKDKSKLNTEWKEDSRIKVEISGSEEVPMYGIIGNINGLISFAMHLANLAQEEVPIGMKIIYKPGKELERDSLPLIIEKTEFDKNVPWAK